MVKTNKHQATKTDRIKNPSRKHEHEEQQALRKLQASVMGKH